MIFYNCATGKGAYGVWSLKSYDSVPSKPAIWFVGVCCSNAGFAEHLSVLVLVRIIGTGNTHIVFCNNTGARTCDSTKVAALCRSRLPFLSDGPVKIKKKNISMFIKIVLQFHIITSNYESKGILFVLTAWLSNILPSKMSSLICFSFSRKHLVTWDLHLAIFLNQTKNYQSFWIIYILLLLLLRVEVVAFPFKWYNLLLFQAHIWCIPHFLPLNILRVHSLHNWI